MRARDRPARRFIGLYKTESMKEAHQRRRGREDRGGRAGNAPDRSQPGRRRNRVLFHIGDYPTRAVAFASSCCRRRSRSVAASDGTWPTSLTWRMPYISLHIRSLIGRIERRVRESPERRPLMTLSDVLESRASSSSDRMSSRAAAGIRSAMWLLAFALRHAYPRAWSYQVRATLDPRHRRRRGPATDIPERRRIRQTRHF
jgi:hypothetical protein